MSDSFPYLGNADSAVIENMYEQYILNPLSVDYSWQKFFEGFEFARTNFEPNSSQDKEFPTEFKVINLINGYRQRGHLFTETNPVRARRKYSPTLDYQNYGLKESDLQTTFKAGHEIGIGDATLQKIIDTLKIIYCKSIGTEYMFIRNIEILNWLQKKLETIENVPSFGIDEKKQILIKLNSAVSFEKFIHKKFPGHKRFSLEGAESMIPALDSILEKGAEIGIREFVIGMAHRGRLNVLANILKKPYSEIFSEFSGVEFDDNTILGDVKYHLGMTTSITTRSGKKVAISLAPNPSHLEAIAPVVQGIVRAKIDHENNGDFSVIAPIIIHGDASIAGQGIVYEVAQMSELPGYKTGGTIHFVINNQLGFTTNYLDGRSSTYCTDVAKSIQCPVFHVNGDDVEALLYVIQFALEFRQKFQKDVFIDLLCYRKYGHNEGDEPRFTQPILYKLIEKHPNPRDIYIEKLIKDDVLGTDEISKIDQDFNVMLENELALASQIKKTKLKSFLEKTWKHIRKAERSDFDKSPDTSVSKETLLYLADKLAAVPANLKLFSKLIKLQDDRKKMVFETNQLDWAMCELLAYGSLIYENIPVRLSGQDVKRGTFSHRHSTLKIEDSEEEFVPLNTINENNIKFDVYNSPLSEYGVLGFEFGYSLATPNTLTIWEAQFGDFFNGAQIIIDQFISSAEDKWNVMNDLVLLLPHGYEGQGPEHSSARIERFLTLCAENNMQIVNCTTPANFFHVLRRQLYRQFRKPLVIFTPKSLLRHPKCVSTLEDLSNAFFHEIIDDSTLTPELITKMLLCNGKVYYDLFEEKESKSYNNVAIIRIEQLYPFPHNQMRAIIKKYSNVEKYIWVQEEPFNMGAWTFLFHEFRQISLKLVARPASGSPATGSSKFHQIQQRQLVEKAFGECNCQNINDQCKMICLGNDITNDVIRHNLIIKEFR